MSYSHSFPRIVWPTTEVPERSDYEDAAFDDLEWDEPDFPFPITNDDRRTLMLSRAAAHEADTDPF